MDSRAPKVVVNALTATFGGGKTVIANVVGRLAALRPEWRFVVLASSPGLLPRAEAGQVPGLEVVLRPDLAGAVPRQTFEQRSLPRWLRERQASALLNFGGFACFGARVPQVSVWQNPNIMTRAPIARSRRTQLFIVAQRAAQAASLPRAAYHVFPTETAVELARARWPMERYPHRAIHWGVDPLDPRATPPPLSEREPLAVAVGHTYFHKNYEGLIDAFGELARNGHSELRLEIAGGAYDPRHHADLEARARAHGLGDRVLFRGALGSDEIEALYRRARVYVTTSLLESFGLTPLEAMSRGVPVVAGRASCLPEVCGEAAEWCDPEDPADIARAIDRVASDSDRAETLRDRGLERITHFRWDDTARAFGEVLDEVLGARS